MHGDNEVYELVLLLQAAFPSKHSGIGSRARPARLYVRWPTQQARKLQIISTSLLKPLIVVTCAARNCPRMSRLCKAAGAVCT